MCSVLSSCGFMALVKIKSGTPPVPCAQRLWSFLSLGGNFGGDVCFPIYGLAVAAVGSAPEKKQRQRAVIESTRTLQGADHKLCLHQTPSNGNTVSAGRICLHDSCRAICGHDALTRILKTKDYQIVRLALFSPRLQIIRAFGAGPLFKTRPSLLKGNCHGPARRKAPSMAKKPVLVSKRSKPLDIFAVSDAIEFHLC